jgi:OmpA-OmpF porin, OOP family
MKYFKYLFSCSLFFFLLNESISQQSIITEMPYIESSNTKEAQINKVEITDKHTIIYMSFQLGRNSGIDSENGSQTLRDLLDILMNGQKNGRRTQSSAFISIRPSSKLIALNGNRTFKYLKASGIPEEPNRLDVFPGERVNFKLYYERIDPGITQFDFFEGDNSDEVRCWNYYKIHITNPAANVLNKAEIEDKTYVKPIYFLKGKVLDEKTKKPINAKIEYLISPSLQAVDSTMTFYNTGNYKINLMDMGIYNCVVSAPGYLIKQESLALTQAEAGNTITKDFLLTPIGKGDVVLLNNVYFETAQYEILTASYSELNQLVNLMNSNPTLTIILEGHTDIVGDKQANIELSQKRVNAVKKYLIEKGIADSRIQTKGWGSSKPLNANGTDEERKVNRRVEFRVLNL